MNRTFALIACSLIALAGCEEKKSAPAPVVTPATPPKSSSSTPAIPGLSPEATKGITDAAAGAKDKVVAGYQAAVDEAKTQIDAWTAKLGGAPADKKPAMQSALDGATAKWNEAKTKVADFKSSTSTEWQKLQADVQTAVDSLKKQMTDAAAAFN